MAVPSTFEFDHEYLKETVSEPLTEALSHLAMEHPEDPVEFIGNFLLKYAENEAHRRQPKRVAPTQSPEKPKETGHHHKETDLQMRLHEESYIQNRLAKEPQSLAQFQQIYLTWLSRFLQAEEAYLGKKCVDGEGKTFVIFVASSRDSQTAHNSQNHGSGSGSVVLEQFVSEEKGITFEVFKEISDPSAPPDAEGNPAPPALPKYIHIENVLREPRIKFFGVPRLGALVTRGLSYKTFLHPEVFNDEKPEEPRTKDEWIVLSVDTIGQARAFTLSELESFERTTSSFIKTLETFEKNLYLREVELRKSEQDKLASFQNAFKDQMAVVEEQISSIVINASQLSDEDKQLKSAEMRLVGITQFIKSFVPVVSSIALHTIGFRMPVLLTLAAVLYSLGYTKKDLFNPASKSPSWEKLSPLFEEKRLLSRLETFNIAALPEVAFVREMLLNAGKADVDASSPIASCWFTWLQAMISYSDLLAQAAAAAEEARKAQAEQEAQEEAA